jgi:hypothetical protein
LKVLSIASRIFGFSLFLAILPLAYAFVIELALKRDALDYKVYLDQLLIFNLLSAPGQLLPKIVSYRSTFWVEHSRGSVFWQDLTVFLFCNLLGWTLVLLAFSVGLRAVMQKIAAARSASSRDR